MHYKNAWSDHKPNTFTLPYLLHIFWSPEVFISSWHYLKFFRSVECSDVVLFSNITLVFVAKYWQFLILFRFVLYSFNTKSNPFRECWKFILSSSFYVVSLAIFLHLCQRKKNTESTDEYSSVKVCFLSLLDQETICLMNILLIFLLNFNPVTLEKETRSPKDYSSVFVQ